MATALPLEYEAQPQSDPIVRLHGATWADYQRLLEMRGDRSAPRIAFLEGELEIMSPSHRHEVIKSLIGRLIEVYCLERGVEFTACGSWTLSDESAARGAEPDECYVFGAVAAPLLPDLAIEVVWTSGGIDKLEIYRRLGVREIWFWRREKISLHALRGDRYEVIAASEVLPGIDVEQLCRFLDRPTASQAIRDYRSELRRG